MGGDGLGFARGKVREQQQRRRQNSIITMKGSMRVKLSTLGRFTKNFSEMTRAVACGHLSPNYRGKVYRRSDVLERVQKFCLGSIRRREDGNMQVNNIGIDGIIANTQQALAELLSVAQLQPGQIIVVGCSTSEVLGHKIGSNPNMEVAEAIYEAIYTTISGHKLYLAVQCCEHLNRALVVERECMERYGLEEVTVVPHPKAGGALATVAFYKFNNAVVVEAIKAHAGIDIGDTLIGMHLRSVAVPVRSKVRSIGHAHVTMARVRPKLIGGERAKYSRQSEVWGDK